MVERYRIFAFTTFYRADSMASPLRWYLRLENRPNYAISISKMEIA